MYGSFNGLFELHHADEDRKFAKTNDAISLSNSLGLPVPE